MTVDQVDSLFPREMHSGDEAADESKEYCWMVRCYSTNLVRHRLTFMETKFARITTVYFDSSNRLIGIGFTASAGPRVAARELHFPGELRFPSELAGGDSAYPELYRRAIMGSTNR